MARSAPPSRETSGTDATSAQRTEVEDGATDAAPAAPQTLDAETAGDAAQTPDTDADTMPEEATGQAEETGADAPDSAGDTAQQPGEAAADAGNDPFAGADTPPAPREVVVERRGGFIPLVLGGVAAAAIGFGAAVYLLPGGWPPVQDPAAAAEAARAALDDRIAALEDRVTALADAPPAAPALDEAAIRDIAEQAAQSAGGGVDTGPLTDRLDRLEAQLRELAARPEPPAPASTPGIDPAEVAQLRDLLDRQEAAVAEAQAAAEDRAARMEERLAALDGAARAARADLARTRLRAALATGEPFADALAELRAAGGAPPDALAAHAATGVATHADLERSFPAAARAGLAAALQATTEDSAAARAWSFLRAQVGARSLEPQAGDDPDAVLSRAEAALAAGDLARALDELAALPEAGRAAMSGWIDRAQARQAATAALDALAVAG